MSRTCRRLVATGCAPSCRPQGSAAVASCPPRSSRLKIGSPAPLRLGVAGPGRRREEGGGGCMLATRDNQRVFRPRSATPLPWQTLPLGRGLGPRGNEHVLPSGRRMGHGRGQTRLSRLRPEGGPVDGGLRHAAQLAGITSVLDQGKQLMFASAPAARSAATARG